MFALIAEVDTGRRIGLWRQKMEGETLRIGRAWDNDLVVQDAFVDPYHLEITAAPEGFWVRDLGSLNGTRCQKVPLQNPRFFIDEIQLRIGKTKLRLIAPGAEVAPAKALREEGRSKKRNPVYWLVGFWIVYLLQAFLFEGQNLKDFEWISLVWTQVGFVVWGVFWNFVAKLFQTESKSILHQGRVARLFVLLFLFNSFFYVLQSFTLESQFLGLLDSGITAYLFGYTLIEQFRSVRPQGAVDKKGMALAYFIMAIFVFTTQYSTGWVPNSAPVFPALEKVAPSINSKEFDTAAQDLFLRIRSQKESQP